MRMHKTLRPNAQIITPYARVMGLTSYASGAVEVPLRDARSGQSARHSSVGI